MYRITGGNYYTVKTHGLVGSHGKEVGHHGREAGGKTGLCDETQFELGKADNVITALPVPGGDVEQVGLECKKIKLYPFKIYCASQQFNSIKHKQGI